MTEVAPWYRRRRQIQSYRYHTDRLVLGLLRIIRKSQTLSVDIKETISVAIVVPNTLMALLFLY